MSTSHPAVLIWLRKRFPALIPLFVIALVIAVVIYDLRIARPQPMAVAIATAPDAERRAWREWYDEVMGPPPLSQPAPVAVAAATAPDAERRAWREWYDEVMGLPPLP